MLINGVNVGSLSRVVQDVTPLAIIEHYGPLCWHYNYRNLGDIPTG